MVLKASLNQQCGHRRGPEVRELDGRKKATSGWGRDVQSLFPNCSFPRLNIYIDGYGPVEKFSKLQLAAEA